MREQLVLALHVRAAAWARDPVLFAREVFGVELWERQPWSKGDSQADFVRAILKSRRIAWRSGHKCGKSRAVAILALWCWVFFPRCRVIFTAPTARQIEKVVWTELVWLYEQAKQRGFALGGRLYETPSKGLIGPEDRQLFGFATDERDRFSGISSPWVFYFVDEASGVDEGIFSAIEGNAAGGAWVVMTGNPTRTEGTFYNAFHRDRAEWLCFHTSSEDGPNIGPLEIAEWNPTDLIPGLAMRGWVEQRRRVWSPYASHNEYRMRVLGQFPTQGANSIVALVHVEAALRRGRLAYDETRATERLHVGFDVARFGDDSNALVLRRGKRIVEVARFSGVDSIQGSGHARKIIGAHLTHHEKSGRGEKALVKVDVIGVGSGVFDQLRRFPELEVLDINVATKADDDEQYANLRSQLWFGAAEWIADGGQLPDDRLLESDLLSPTYGYDSRGRRKMESKDDIKQRLGRSPDTGDAMALCVYAAGSWMPTPFVVPGLLG